MVSKRLPLVGYLLCGVAFAVMAPIYVIASGGPPRLAALAPVASTVGVGLGMALVYQFRERWWILWPER